MKKEIKAGLKEIYEAPPSLKKDEFLQRIGEPELTHLEFLRMQVHYIRKGNWLISVVFFLSALFALRQAELELLWPISAFVPFLALSVVAENSRSFEIWDGGIGTVIKIFSKGHRNGKNGRDRFGQSYAAFDSGSLCLEEVFAFDSRGLSSASISFGHIFESHAGQEGKRQGEHLLLPWNYDSGERCLCITRGDEHFYHGANALRLLGCASCGHCHTCGA